MPIPIEADGIVDDEKAFRKQQKENEAQLKGEIKSAQQDEDELYIDDYEDIEFIPFKEPKNNPEKLLRDAKRKQVLGHGSLGIFAKIAA